MTSFKNRVHDMRFFCNIDKTAVYLYCKPIRAVHIKSEKTVSIRFGVSSANRCIVCITVSMDGTKLPLFFIFKATPRGRIDTLLADILPKSTVGICQRKAYSDFSYSKDDEDTRVLVARTTRFSATPATSPYGGFAIKLYLRAIVVAT
eukprot:IDg20423t1